MSKIVEVMDVQGLSDLGRALFNTVLLCCHSGNHNISVAHVANRVLPEFVISVVNEQ